MSIILEQPYLLPRKNIKKKSQIGMDTLYGRLFSFAEHSIDRQLIRCHSLRAHCTDHVHACGCDRAAGCCLWPKRDTTRRRSFLGMGKRRMRIRRRTTRSWNCDDHCGRVRK